MTLKPPTKTDLLRALSEAARHRSTKLHKLATAQAAAKEKLLAYENSNPVLQEHRAVAVEAIHAYAEQERDEHQVRNSEIVKVRLRLHLEGVTTDTIKAVKDLVRKLSK